MHLTSTSPARKKPLPFEFVPTVEKGNRLMAEGKAEEAESYYNKAAKLCPEAWLGIACEELKAGNQAMAMTRFKQVLEHATHEKTRAVCMNNIGMILNNYGCRSISEKWFRDSYALWKRSDTAANIALCCMYDQRPEESESWIGKSIRLEPTNHTVWFNKALLSLMKGDYKTGFREYEARFKNPQGKIKTLPVHRKQWNGEPLAGKTLMVYAEQGAGDTIQMLRYGPLLKAMGATLLLAPQAGLGPLAEQQGCWDAIYEDLLQRIEKADVPPWDYQVPAMCLPRILGTTLENIPASPYLQEPAKMFHPEQGRLNIGFVWAGSLDHAHDLWRSSRLEEWLPLFQLPGTAWHSLQLGQRTLDLMGGEYPVNDLSPRLKDYSDTAAAIMAMDLIVSVDTSVVHLAGALGKPVWMLTPYCPDWRWMLHREDSPWYSSLRLFRQSKELDWPSVIERIKHALQPLIANPARTDGLQPERQIHRPVPA
jgi:tetratricopeptide (TPR) repeat protein